MARRNYRQFFVTFTAVVHVSPRAIRQGMSKRFAENIFPATSPERVAERVAFNMVVNNIELPDIDGFATLPNADAFCERATVEDCYEITPEKKPTRRAGK